MYSGTTIKPLTGNFFRKTKTLCATLRDLFAGNRPYIFIKHVYACAALLGAVVCVYLWSWTGRYAAMLVGFCVVFALRLCSAHFRWSLPHARRLAEEEEKKPS